MVSYLLDFDSQAVLICKASLTMDRLKVTWLYQKGMETILCDFKYTEEHFTRVVPQPETWIKILSLES